LELASAERIEADPGGWLSLQEIERRAQRVEPKHQIALREERRVLMKAIRLLEYGGQLVFNDVPTPRIARDEILVKIRNTAINHLDIVEASGTARQILPIDLPWIPGHEFSGVVEQIGSDVAAFSPGDAVFGTTSGMGAYAEYLAVKAAAVARKPSNLSFEEAASVPVASQTA
jgi:NADPH:quinone reductase-like Zn-dependent oxidoreductase